MQPLYHFTTLTNANKILLEGYVRAKPIPTLSKPMIWFTTRQYLEPSLKQRFSLTLEIPVRLQLTASFTSYRSRELLTLDDARAYGYIDKRLHRQAIERATYHGVDARTEWRIYSQDIGISAFMPPMQQQYNEWVPMDLYEFKNLDFKRIGWTC